MKVSAYLFLLVCTIAVPAFAVDGPAPALEIDADPIASPAVDSCNAPLEDVLFAADTRANAVCTADCGPHTDVTCSSSGTCVAVDRNCPSTPGYVTCNGVTTYCPNCAGAQCNEGAFRMEWTGNCCECGSDERALYKCIGGQWVLQNIFCGPGIHCPFC